MPEVHDQERIVFPVSGYVLMLVFMGVLLALMFFIWQYRLSKNRSSELSELEKVFSPDILGIVAAFKGPKIDAAVLSAEAERVTAQQVDQCVDFILQECLKRAKQGSRVCEVRFLGVLAARTYPNVVPNKDQRLHEFLSSDSERKRVCERLESIGIQCKLSLFDWIPTSDRDAPPAMQIPNFLCKWE